MVIVKPMGYDPMVNPIHAWDVEEILKAVVFKNLSGIFNIAGPDIAPLSVFLRLSGKPCIGIPGGILTAANFLLRQLGVTKYDYTVNADRLNDGNLQTR